MKNYLKDEYIEIFETAKKEGLQRGCYTASMIFKLRDMAKEDIYPDGRFGDEECNIWSAFHMLCNH